MNDIEKKAREYAGDAIFNAEWNDIEYACEAEKAEEDIKKAFLAGASYALGNQWRDAEKEKPEHNHLVLAEIEADIPEIRFCTAYYQDEIWATPDDFYYGCKVLRWLEIPEYKPKEE